MKSVAFACAALAASVPAIAASPKWVPLDSHAAKVMQGQAVSATHKATAAPVASPVASMPQVPAPPAVAVHAIPSPPAIAPEAPVGAGNVGAQIPLQITCFGGGTANKIASATATSIGSVSGSVGGAWINGNTFGTTTISGTRQQAFGDQVDIRLFAGDDRIRLPRTILPPIHGGQAGWFKLKNVVADARSIHASAAINFMSNPKVYIDRVTGTISISGRSGDYTGQCQAIQADVPAKF